MSNINNEIQVFKNNGELVVSSRQVAEDFGKRHTEVLRAIDNHIESLKSTDAKVRWFYLNDYTDNKGELRKEYLMNRDGFCLLVMSFNNTRDVLQWKIKYINAFNAMEKKLKELSAPKTLDSLFNIDTLYLIVSKLKEEHDGLKAQITEKDTTIARLEAQLKNPPLLPEQLDTAEDDDRLYTVTEIANEFDVKAITLNKLLIAWKLQHKVGAHYEMCEGIDESKYVHYTFYRGAKAQMKWTGAGRLLIHSRMKQHGYSLVK